MLTLGVPKEIKPLEKRVALTPSGVLQLTRVGAKVLVQKNAGAESGFSDSEYQASGAEVIADAASLYGRAQIIQKVKEPLPPEFPFLRKDHIFFCFLHLASPENCGLVNALQKSFTTAIAYETLEKDGKLLLLAPMSEIAGGLSAAYAAYIRTVNIVWDGSIVYPSEFHAKLVKIAGEYPNVSDPGLKACRDDNAWETVIFGGGVAGFKAMEVALALGGKVTVIEKNEERRAFLKKFTPHVYSPDENLKPVLEKAEVLIGCVHARGQRAFKVLNEQQMRGSSAVRKKIIMDISIDQGGNFPEAHSTTYQHPLYVDSLGNTRFGVPNIPSLCGRSASEALSNVSWPYSAALAAGAEDAFKKYPELAAAVNVRAGQIQIQAIKDVHRQ